MTVPFDMCRPLPARAAPPETRAIVGGHYARTPGVGLDEVRRPHAVHLRRSRLRLLGVPLPPVMLNVGWLSQESEYATGPFPPHLLARLEELARRPVVTVSWFSRMRTV